MRITVLLIVVAISFLLGDVSQVHGQQTAVGFFDSYVRLSSEFDDGVASLYSDDAVITSYRRYPHGLERAAEMDGAQMKKLIVEFMPMARQRNDRSEFTDVRVEVEGERAKIRATRYSIAKCYQDTAYYMVIERLAGGEYYIVEEHTETQPQSDCGLEITLLSVAKQYNASTPAMVDADTRLDRVEYLVPSTLEFRYTLVNVSGTEFELNEMEAILRELHLEQTCSTPFFQQLLGKGATVKYAYVDREGIAMFAPEINAASCK